MEFSKVVYASLCIKLPEAPLLRYQELVTDNYTRSKVFMDKRKDSPILDPIGWNLHQLTLGDCIEEFLQI